MSLDQNLFTLLVTQNKENPHVVDLMDPSGTMHYRKHRLPGDEYKVEVYDPISQSLLITATSPTAISKAKTLELYNPTILVDLKYTGTLSFRWGFKWEEHEFEWKREECFMLRKPDPPVLVAVTKEPAGRLKTTSVQILDYNLNRFDINDRKGLEIVILTALLTFSDANEGHRAPQEPSRNASRSTTSPPDIPLGPQPTQQAEIVPLPPPKPAPKTGVDRIAEMQASHGDYNEITVGDEGQVQHYAEYCSRLLEDDAMLFVTLRSAAAEQVPKVLQVVEETKRIRHKAGLEEETELHQYVLYETEKKKGPRRINLDDNVKPTNAYSPPTSLIVHLSKIDMPELQPKATPGERPTPSNSSSVRDTSRPGKEGRKASRQLIASRPETPPSAARVRSSSPVAQAQSRPHVSSSPPSPPNNRDSYVPPSNRTSSRPNHNSSLSFPTPTIPTLGSLNTGSWDHELSNSYPRSPHPHSGIQSSTPASPHLPHGSNSSYYNAPLTSASASASHPSSAPPPHPSVSLRPPSPLSQQRPSLVSGLLDSFRRR